MTQHRELELKLEIAPRDAERLRNHPLLAWAPMSEERQDSIYFDTPKRRLRRAGYSLRVRRSGKVTIQTVKRQGTSTGLFDRTEWETDLRRMRPDITAARATPLGEVLSEKRAAKLAPVVRMRMGRTIWDVDDARARIEVAADLGTVKADGIETRVSELELELKRGSKSALFDFCEKLAKRLPLRLSVLSKADLAFALADGKLGRIAKAPSIELSPGMSVADAFAAIIMSCLKHFRLNEPLLVEEHQPEAVHQMRVAIRRLRSALVLFRPVIKDDPELAQVRKDLRWIGTMLGEARNLDVFIAGLGESAAEVPRLGHRRDERYARIIVALDSRRFLGLMLRIVRWLTIGAWRDSAAAEAELGRFLDGRIDKAWDRVARASTPLADMGEKSRHALRIDIKKLRYAVEFAESLHVHHRRKAKQFGSVVEALQDELGALNDMTNARRLARKYLGGVTDDRETAQAHLVKAQLSFGRLLRIGPYWRPRPQVITRPATSAVRRRAGSARPAASRRHAPRSGGSVRG